MIFFMFTCFIFFMYSGIISLDLIVAVFLFVFIVDLEVAQLVRLQWREVQHSRPSTKFFFPSKRIWRSICYYTAVSVPHIYSQCNNLFNHLGVLYNKGLSFIVEELIMIKYHSLFSTLLPHSQRTINLKRYD